MISPNLRFPMKDCDYSSPFLGDTHYSSLFHTGPEGSGRESIQHGFHRRATGWLVENPLVFLCYKRNRTIANNIFFFGGLSKIDHGLWWIYRDISLMGPWGDFQPWFMLWEY